MINRYKQDIVTKHDVILLDLDSGERLHLQGLPEELDVRPETSWATIRPFGRNLPHYQFTGSEDIIVMNISWYPQRDDLTDVIEKCKWIESLTKADGYFGRPHTVALIWGDLFRNYSWIVDSAPYRLSNYSGDHGYRPRDARQEVTLKRISDTNLTLKEILEY